MDSPHDRENGDYPDPHPAHLAAPQGSQSMGRKKSLVRPERSRSHDPHPMSNLSLRRRVLAVHDSRHDSLRRSLSIKRDAEREGPKMTCWVILSRILTFFLPSFLLTRMGKRDANTQQAFREKIALCMIIFFLMCTVGFLTFGFTVVLCPNQRSTSSYGALGTFGGPVFAVHGRVYNLTMGGDGKPVNPHAKIAGMPKYASTNWPVADKALANLYMLDVSAMFPPVPGSSNCNVMPTFPVFPCTVSSPNGGTIWPVNLVSELTMTWSDITNGTVSYIVYNGKVLNLSPLLALPQEKRLSYFGQDVLDLAIPNIGRDVTLQFAAAGLQREAECLVELFRFATVDFSSDGCLGAQVVLITSFAIIGVVVAARFFLALYFSYAIGWRLGNSKAYAKAMEDLRRRRAEQSEARRRPDGSGMANVVDIPLDAVARGGAKARQGDPRFSVNPRASVIKDPSNRADNWSYNFGFMDMEAPQVDAETEKLLNDPTLMHTLVMVPCYSEGYESLEATLTSVARSYYPSTHKCLFVIADGIVKGSENSRTTPEILIDMIEVDERFRKDDPRWGGEPEAFSYVAIADGNKRKNYARVYAGWYRYDPATDEASKKKKDRASAAPEETREEGGAQMRTLRERKEGRVPMLLIVKVGNEEERESGKEKKPGNRGKRDSQVILMNFLSKVMFDDRMTELEFDIFFKLFTITGINPERYEGVLMVDADTRIYPDSLTHMVACLLRDHRVMGLCGETKILNKWESWVTMIQVFEYFVSHHLAKAFESVFGGVTCLPGCFSMYRVKTPKGPNGYWVPILANPDIVEEYSENIVDTLHKKNLLLLGEDRFLSTMMLRNFPKRRMVFVPPAICKTVVPNTFKVLLSQRRRWINSTIHNLMELVLVKDLCGTFCISMQFVIFMELVGTVVLPAAITFTLILCGLALGNAIHPGLTGVDYSLPLYLLAGILGLPAVLILLTANKVIYVFWMIIYLFSLPIWNFVLPLYAFWHFDDFSWGETRKVIGEVKGHDHSTADGEFDSTGISMKRWREWVKVRKDEANASEMERSRGYSRFPEQNGRMSMSSSTLQGSSQSLNFGRIPQYLVNTPSFSAVGSTIPIMPPGVQPPPNLVAPPPGMMPPQVGMYGRPPANYLMYPQFNMSSPGPSARHVNPYHTDSENDFVPGGSTLPGADK